MEDMFNEIRRGLDAGVYQLALNMALCIPDICAALESEDGKASPAKYKSWYERYVAGRLRLSASDCYYFRCSFLHQGTTEHDRSSYDKIIFIEPNDRMVLHNNVLEGALNIDVRLFCIELIGAATQWLNDVRETQTFKDNYEKSFRRYPNGIAPYIVGAPVYA